MTMMSNHTGVQTDPTAVLALALTLDERAETLRAGRQAGGDSHGNERSLSLERHWRALPWYLDTHAWERRLRTSGLTPSDVPGVLAPGLLGPEAPAWVRDVIAVAGITAAESRRVIDEMSPPSSLGLLSLVEPHLAWAIEILRGRVRQVIPAADVERVCPLAVEQSLIAWLARRFSQLVTRPLLVEMHGMGLGGQLAGDSPQDRYTDFVARLGEQPVRARILSLYPVLTRLLVEEARRWCEASVEVLGRLWSEWEQIRHDLLDTDPIAVTRIEAGLGDLHRNGRSVNLISFASGARVMYKPRSLELDRAFSEMLDAFNALDGCEPLRVARVIDRGDYGFVEFISNAACESQADIEAFYTKVGELLALFHLLNATDFHYENLIAHGSTPVPIDLETLMVPCVWTQNSVRRLDRLRSMERSLLRTGMLTPKPYGGAGDIAVDVSALGMTQPQETPYKVMRMANVDTDDMRVERQSVTIHPGANTPRIGDERFFAADYEPQILDGFERIYRLVQTSDVARRALAVFLEQGKGSRVRAIMRLTRAYSMLLQDSWHPELLADAVERDIYLDSLFRDSIHSDALTQVACAERQAIMSGDIPFFEAEPGSRSLLFPSGQELPDFFDFSGVEECERNIDNLGEADLSRHLWIIRASMAATRNAPLGVTRRDAPRPVDRSELAAERLIARATSIRDRLRILMYEDGTRVGWMGLLPAGEKTWGIAPVGSDLYNGLAGLAMFFLYHGRLSGSRESFDLARRCLSTACDGVQDVQSPAIGLFEGSAGVIYTLAHAGKVLGDPEYVTCAEQLLPRLESQIESDERLDVLAGTAGCIEALRVLDAVHPSSLARRLAIQCGERLLAKRQPQCVGHAWLTVPRSDRALAGFSHGAAGIGWALLGLAAMTGREDFATAAWEAWAYEDDLRHAYSGFWPDLREGSREASILRADGLPSALYTTTWCHGAPGIGLSRLRALRYRTHADDVRDVELAVEHTCATAFVSGQHCLCHGDLGSLELLREASVALGRDEWHARLEAQLCTTLGSLDAYGCICATPSDTETPGLMVGLAGIGYALLRQASPGLVPNVLVAEGPARVRR